MKIPRFYIILVGLSILLFILIEMLRDRPVSWEPNFSSRETMPYGTYALYQLLPGIFPGKTITRNFKNYEQMFRDGDINDESIIIINTDFSTDTYAMDALLQYVEDGHQVLISAFNLDGHLMDTLGIRIASQYNGVGSMGRGNPVEFVFADKKLNMDSIFHYNFSLYSYFEENDTAGYKVLGKFLNGKPNFIGFTMGDGELFLSTIPLAFTNFNILKGYTQAYAEGVFSMMDVNDVIWDEYVRHIQIESSSPLRYILSMPALRYAFLILLLFSLLYIVFAGKRRQQIIPVLVPLENSSRRFIQTLSRLYLYRNNHKDIAIKKIRFFTDVVQTKYSIRIKKFDEAFVNRYAQKSGKSEKSLIKLISLIKSIEAKDSINENELFEVCKLIDEQLDAQPAPRTPHPATN